MALVDKIIVEASGFRDAQKAPQERVNKIIKKWFELFSKDPVAAQEQSENYIDAVVKTYGGGFKAIDNREDKI